MHNHFRMLLEIKDSDNINDQSKNIENELEAIWEGLIDDKQSQKILSAAGFDKPDQALNLLDNIKNDLVTQTLSREGRERLNKLIPLLLKKVCALKQPSLTLNRIVDLIKTIERRSCYISLLLENPNTLTHLVKLSNASPRIARFLARYPVLLDELLDPRTLYVPPNKDELKKELDNRFKQIHRSNLEYQIEELCMFKQVNVLRVAAADVTAALPIMKVSDHLTEIAETILNEVLELAWEHLVEKHGRPICFVNGKKCEQGFTVIAYGKLGGIELGYASDLDLVFLHAGIEGKTRGGKNPVDNSYFFARLGQRVIHILSAHSSAGVLYETDMRLRPSGSSGLLVSHIGAFNDYQTTKAWTWEHQAIIRARAISGDSRVAEIFDQIRKNVLLRPRNSIKLKEEVRSMRERMRKKHSNPEQGVFDIKQDRGGIVDIEFLVQYLVLLKAYEHPELIKWTDNVRLLETMIETDSIDSQTSSILKDAYLKYRITAHMLSLQEKPNKVPENKFCKIRGKVEKVWNFFIESR